MEKCENDQPNCFVGLVDILGFKNLFDDPVNGITLEDRTRRIHNTMVVAYVDTQDFLVKIGMAKGGPVQNGSYRHVVSPEDPKFSDKYWSYVRTIAESMHFFSDTVYYHIPASKEEHQQKEQIRALCYVTNLITKLPSLFKKKGDVLQVVMRGAVSYGPIMINDVFCGKPIIDAYLLAEGQEWMGGAVHHSMNAFISTKAGRESLVRFDAPLFRYKVPLKGSYKEEHQGEKTEYALNWVQSHPAIPDCCAEVLKYRKPRPIRKDLINGNLGYYRWNHEKKKKRNTLRFVDSILKEYDNSDEYGIK